MHVPDGQRKKLDAKVSKAIIVDYPLAVKDTEVVRPGGEIRFMISRNAKFFEDSRFEKLRSFDADQSLPSSVTLEID